MLGRMRLALLAVALGAAVLADARVRRRCYSHHLERYFRGGERWVEPGCRRARCRRGRVVLTDCPTIAETADCALIDGDPAADPPGCCPRLLCAGPGQCLARHPTPRLVNVGDEWTEPGCTRVVCTESGVSRLPCGLFHLRPGCSLEPAQEDAEYPRCCPQQRCPGPEWPCHDRDLDRRFAVGDQWTALGCGRATCFENGEVGVVGCPAMAYPFSTSCSMDDGTPGLEFPQCCPRFTCEECFSEQQQRHMGPGDAWTEAGCVRARCRLSANGTADVVREDCAPPGPPPSPDCTLAVPEPDGEHPRCCPTYRCPAHCFSAALGKWFAADEQWTEPGCTRARCTAAVGDDGSALAALLPCGLVALAPDAPAGCRIVAGDATAEYPNCCPRGECEPPPPPPPGGGCYVESLQRLAQPGESWTGPGCTQATCLPGGGVAGKGCGLVGVPSDSPCHLDDGRPGEQYPQCCPKIVCPHCYSERQQRYLGPGEEWTGPGCSLNHCDLRGVSGKGCGTMAVPPGSGCHMDDGDLEKEYPQCCPKPVCPVPY